MKIYLKYVILVLFFSCLSSLKAEEGNSYFSCSDFDKIYEFTVAEHLRFRSKSKTDLQKLVLGAIDQLPEYLTEDGFHMLSANFVRNETASILKAKARNTKQLCEALGTTALRGMFMKAFVKSLDPYSDFYLAEESSKRTSVVDGHFVGVGIGTLKKPDFIKVTEVIDEGPSDKVLMVDDKITHIDDYPIRGLSHSELRARIRGPLHSKVRFRVERADKVLTLEVTRDHVYQKSVTHSWEEEDKVLSIKIHRFFAHTAPTIRALLLAYDEQMRGIILDLRDNPGGLLQGARDVVDIFVSLGVVVYLRGAYDDQMWAYQDGGFTKSPLVILINEKTASASEIVAGALQDYGRAVLVGSQTFGKSCVQSIFNTQTDLGTTYQGGLKLTTLWFYLPSGRSVAKLQPDVVVATSESEGEEVKRSVMPYEWPSKIDVTTMFEGTSEFKKSVRSKVAGLPVGQEESEAIGKEVLLRMLALDI